MCTIKKSTSLWIVIFRNLPVTSTGVKGTENAKKAQKGAWELIILSKQKTGDEAGNLLKEILILTHGNFKSHFTDFREVYF